MRKYTIITADWRAGSGNVFRVSPFVLKYLTQRKAPEFGVTISEQYETLCTICHHLYNL